MTCMSKVLHYFLQVYLKTLETNALKYMNLILLIFCLHLDYLDKLVFKKAEVELELFTEIDMLLMIEKGIRGGICHAIHRYARANDKYMKSYNKNIESSYLEFLDANNLYGWGMSPKLAVNGFKQIKKLLKFNERIKNYDENSNKGYILEIDFEYPKNIHGDLPFLAERKKIKKCNKLVCNI